MGVVFMAATLAAAAWAGELVVTIPVDQSGIDIGQAGPYTTVRMDGEALVYHEGAPSLPVVSMRVALPTGTVAEGIEILDCSWTQVRGRHEIMPAEPCLPFSVESEITPVVPDPHIYGLSTPWPFEPVELTGSGVILGIPVADITVCPARWNPADGRLELLSSLTLRVTTAESPEALTILRRSAGSEQRAMDIVRATVVNPADVAPSGAMIVSSRDLEYGEYVIITHQDYETQMQELADWKTAKGVPANVYTVPEIQALYSCWDMQQELRAFLTDCRLEGAEFILIVGDDDKVAARDAILSAGGNTDYAPVDLYFADNNDTAPGADRWDSNTNHIWGETSDNVDWHPDFLVGRASVNSTAEASLFVDKVLWYEHFQALPTTDYFETAPNEMRVGYSTGILWYSPYCPGSAGAEIISSYVPSSAWEEEKLHEGTTGNSTAMTIAMINAGPHHVYHASHGSETGMYTANGDNFSNTQIMNLTNITTGDNVAIWNSIACLIGAIDTGLCCGDAWNNSPAGGGFGNFNSRYGWGSPSNPGYGPSEVICERVYYEDWELNIHGLGAAHAMALDHFSPPSDAYMNWCVKEYNLLGDPEVYMWTADATNLTVVHPASIPGAQNVTITVNGQSGPLSGARVCIQKGDWQTGEVYEVGTTNASGQVTLYANPLTAGNITVTAWAYNYNPYQGTIACGTGVGGGESGELTGFHSLTPSPATDSAVLSFGLAAPGRVTIRAYDTAGRVVATLADNEMTAGEHTLAWDLRGGTGSTVPAGVYTVRFETTGFSATRSLVVLR